MPHFNHYDVVSCRVAEHDPCLAIRIVMGLGATGGPEGDRQGLLRLAARPQRKVFGQHIDHHGRKHQERRGPKSPIPMRSFPVRTMIILKIPALRVGTLVHNA